MAPGETIDDLRSKSVRIGQSTTSTSAFGAGLIITNRGTGDSMITFSVTDDPSSSSITMGMDNSNSDSFAITRANSGLSTTSGVILDTNDRLGLANTPNASARLSITPTSTISSIFMANSAITVTPSGGGYLLVSGGALFYVGSSGTTTQVAGA